MAKATAKKAAQPVRKTAAPRSKTKLPSVSIEKVCEQVLEKFKALKVEHQLQGDIEWCLGSYRYDQNPVGLYQNGAKALGILQAIKAKNTKSVPAKLITDLEKALKQA